VTNGKRASALQRGKNLKPMGLSCPNFASFGPELADQVNRADAFRAIDAPSRRLVPLGTARA